MTEENMQRIADALERIAYALEIANLNRNPPTLPAGSGGYQCTRCWAWVNPGQPHGCNNFSTFSVSVSDSPTARLNPNGCFYITAAGMQCTLAPGHTGAHDLGIG